jgi:hypothetical protein
MYHPTLGRFVQRDPIGYEAGTNLQAYVGSSPCSYNDASGLEGKTPKVKLHVKQTHAGGSVEAIPLGGGRTRFIYAVPEEGWKNRAWYWLEGGTWEALYGSLGDIRLHEELRGDDWFVVLHVWTRLPWQGYKLRVCPDYGWEISVENVCCASGNIRVFTGGGSGPQPDQGEVGFEVPMARLLVSVPMDSEPVLLGTARVYAIYEQFRVGDFRTSAAAWVRARCEE